MSILSRSALTAFTLLLCAASPASADVFLWQDPQTKMSLTVPDSWKMTHNQQPGDQVTFVAPSDDAFPVCRMRIREDRRFLIYPQRYSRSIQHLHYSREFWEDYIGEIGDARVDRVFDDAGLGRGYGTFAELSYVPFGGVKRGRRALVFASLYRDKAYVLECSVNAGHYPYWAHKFLSVAKSVEFREERSQLPGGHYKRLYGTPAIEIANKRKIDTYYGYGVVPKYERKVPLGERIRKMFDFSLWP